MPTRTTTSRRRAGAPARHQGAARQTRPLRLPAALLALTACLAGPPPAQAIVIQVNTLDSDGSILARYVSDGWHLVHPYPTNPAYFDYRKNGMVLDTPANGRFQVLSFTEPWNLGGGLVVDSVNVAALTVGAGGNLVSRAITVAGQTQLDGSLQAGDWGASFGSLQMNGGSLSSDSWIHVSGHAELRGTVTGNTSAASLTMTGGRYTGNASIIGSLSLRDTLASGDSFTAQSARIAYATLSDLRLSVRDDLQMTSSRLGQAGAAAAGLEAAALTLTDNSTVHVRHLAVGQSLQMADSRLEAADSRLDRISDLVLVRSTLRADGFGLIDSLTHLDLKASDLLLTDATLTLVAGSTGALALGIDAKSTLQTGSTWLQGGDAGTWQETVFTQAAGRHSTGWLWVPTGTAYVLAAPAAGAAGPALAGNVSIAGALRMRGGTLTSGSLEVLEGGSFAQSAGLAVFQLGWGVGGQATLSGTAQVEAQSTRVGGRGLQILESARLQAGALTVGAGNLLLNRPGDTQAEPALHSTSTTVFSGFQHTAGFHLADSAVGLASGSSDTTSGWYWLDGGTLKTPILWNNGHFVQHGGMADIGRLSISAVHTPLDANLLLAGGSLQVGRLEVWGPTSPLIRQTGGIATIDTLSLNGGRYELAIEAAWGADDLQVRQNLWIASTEAHTGTFSHSAGRLLSQGYHAVDAKGAYLLSGTGVFDGSQSQETFEVLAGGRFDQQGEATQFVARGMSIDPGAQGTLRGGKTELREFLAVMGSLQITGRASVDVMRGESGQPFGLYVGVPFLPDEGNGVVIGQAPGSLTLALSETGLLRSSQVAVGTFESGVIQHDSGRHQVDGMLTLGSTLVLADAVYLLGSTAAGPTAGRAELDAGAITLQNPLARSDADRNRVRLEQVLGRSSVAFQSFTNQQGLHYVHAEPEDGTPQDGARTWRLGDYQARDGSRLHASYASEGGALFVNGGLQLADNSRMTISPSAHVRGWAEVQGDLQITGNATLALADQMLLRDGDGRPTLMVRGGLLLDARPGDDVGWAMAVRSATVQVQGAGVAVDRATVSIGPSRHANSLLLDGSGTLMQISGAQRTQLHIGTQGAGVVTVNNHAAVELRAAPAGTARPVIAGDWRPLVVGNSSTPGQPSLTVKDGGRLLIEGRGNQITVASGTAHIAGQLHAVVVGKPGSPALVGAPLSSGLLSLQTGSQVEVTFDGYTPRAGDYIPLAAAHSIGYAAGTVPQLTPYKAITIGSSAVAGYEFSLGAGNAVFRVAAPSPGLYPALERMRVGGTEVLGIRFIEQAVVLNFGNAIQGSYQDRGTGTWDYDPKAASNLQLADAAARTALVQAYGQAMWAAPPSTDGRGQGDLGHQVLLPYFVSDTGAPPALKNVVDVRFTAADMVSAGQRLLGRAPGTLNTTGWFGVDLGNQQKAGAVHIFSANSAAPTARLVNTLMHEVGHSLGLVHTYEDDAAHLMDYADQPDAADQVYANVPLTWTESPKHGGTRLWASQNAMVTLLKYTYGWSDAELQAFGAEYGSFDLAPSSWLAGAAVGVRAGLSLLPDFPSLQRLSVLLPSLSEAGSEVWEPLLVLDAPGAAALADLQFTGLRGLPFRIVGTVAGNSALEVRFVGNAQGYAGSFGEGLSAGRLVQVDLLTGATLDLGGYTLRQAAAVPEPSTAACLLAGGLLLAAARRRARRHPPA